MTARRKSILLFLVGVIGIGWLIGATNLPGAWYAALQKPSFNPPNWIFGPTWTVLYVMIAIAGWRTFREEKRSLAMQVWFGQMLFNFLWSPTVFSFHNLAVGLAIILTMLFLIVTFIGVQWKANRTAALLFVPYAVWVAFATTLNYALYRLN